MPYTYTPAPFETAAQEAAAIIRARAVDIRHHVGREVGPEQVADNLLACADEIDKAADWLEQQDSEGTS